jgi:hypothetical protein
MRRSRPTDTPVVPYERAIDEIDPPAWDRFVVASRGSFLGSWRVIRAEGLLAPLRVFELYAAGPSPRLKIGQCALAITHGGARFLDRLQLLPLHDGLWLPALQRVLERCGAARYTYGSPWNAEPRCLDALRAAVPGARVTDAATGIDAVSFPAWRDFAAYRRAVSENIRRDYKKAAAAAPTVVVRRGIAACRDIAGLVGLRRQVMRRNQEPFSVVIDAPLHALKLLCMGDDAFIATVRAGGRPEAAFFGVEFGERVYYVSGGTRDRSDGFGSYLFLTLLERWFAESPRGALYLGVTEPGLVPETYTLGNLLYRRKLRAASIPATAFTLDLA